MGTVGGQLSSKMGALGSFVLTIIKLTFFLWSLITNVFYSLFSNPALTRKNHEKIRSRPSQPINEDDKEVTFIPCAWQKTPFIAMFEEQKFETLVDIWNWALQRYGDRRQFGTREILEEKEVSQHNGKSLRKQKLGNYKWMSYTEADNLVEHLGRGLRVLGQQPNNNICIFADTRVEWILSAQACFRNSFPVVTIYTNLGMEGILHGLVETEVEVVLTSHELLPKFKTLLQADNIKVKTIIYMESPILTTDTTGFGEGIKIVSFMDVVSLGLNAVDSTLAPKHPSPATPAIIMYTSGSTGTPKGVVLSHKNLVFGLTSLIHFNNPEPTDLYIAYLPIAHVFELLGEMIMVAWGVGIGYGHPNTLLDSSTMVMSGCKGDLTSLQPTIMFCVPMVLDRLFKGITENISKKSPFVQSLMEFCIEYKTNCTKQGQITPIMDRLIFGKIKKVIGGRVRTLVSGGAPLSSSTHEFLRAVMGVTLQQGYGLTETGASSSVMDPYENSSGRVGSPLDRIHLRLVNWEEGNYKVTDKPCPRGEILIGGDNVAQGYFKLEEKTREEFFTDENSRRWFKTGDIGQMEADGTIRIIDRKKDLLKLQLGEYVSLGKVESILKGCPVVANICVFGESSRSYVVAVICPQVEKLTELATELGKPDQDLEAMCLDTDITELVLKQVLQHGLQSGLKKFEIPGAVTLTSLEWTPNTGLITAAMKLRRLPLQKHYQESFDKMYTS